MTTRIAQLIWEEEQKIQQTLIKFPSNEHLLGVQLGLQIARDIAESNDDD